MPRRRRLALATCMTVLLPSASLIVWSVFARGEQPTASLTTDPPAKRVFADTPGQTDWVCSGCLSRALHPQPEKPETGAPKPTTAVGDVHEQIALLHARIAGLEARLKTLESEQHLVAFPAQQPLVIQDPVSTGVLEGWQEREINGMKFYTIPLEDFAKSQTEWGKPWPLGPLLFPRGSLRQGKPD